MTDYEKQATDFLAKANATIEIEFKDTEVNKKWEGEKTPRDCYEVALATPRGSYLFRFWDGINNTNKRKAKNGYKPPSAYDVLSRLAKYEVGSLSSFCFVYGYGSDSLSVGKIYYACLEAYANLCRIFTPEQMDELREIN